MIQLIAPLSYDRGVLSIKIPLHAETTFRTFAEKLAGGPARIELQKWYRPRSTGPDSQSHHINGHLAQIAMATGNDFETVKTYCKQEAIPRGYPFDTIRDIVIPWSERRIDVQQAAILIDTVHQLAAELGILLKEE